MTAPRPPAEDHLELHLGMVRYLLVDRMRRERGDLDAVLARYPFLAAEFRHNLALMPPDLAWDDAPAWWEKRVVDFEQQHTGSHLPLAALDVNGSLGLGGRLALVAAGAVEEDARIGGVYADLQEPITTPRPTLATLTRLLAAVSEPRAVERALLATGLVEIPNHDDPRTDWLVRVPLDLWDALREAPPMGLHRHRAAGEAPALEGLDVAPTFADQLRRVPPLLATGRLDAVIVRGRRGSERDDVAGSLAAAMGRGTLTVDLDACRPADLLRLGPIAAALGAMPVLVVDPGPGEQRTIDRLRCYDGPVAVILGPTGGVGGGAVARSVTLEVPTEGPDQRRRIWSDLVPDADAASLDDLSRRILLPAGHLRQVAAEAAGVALLANRGSPTVADVVVAGRALDRSSLETQAVRLRAYPTPVRLVASPQTQDKLAHLVRRCRHRESLAAHTGPGFGGEATRGVRALFTGRSGTGKTMAARLLAAELGMDLYRVDLAAIVNKYVGETEKNLHAVLSAAEEHDVVLLIDEGDALMTSRTNVRSANDRYANLETDFLLQRLESHQGVVLVTTNMTDNVDQAFHRRMDVVVAFVEPGPHERWELWELHLPLDHGLDVGFLEGVADRCALTGGQIRNAALYATLLALDGGEPLSSRHVEAAIASEYGKAGAASPLGASGAAIDAGRGVQAFLEALG